jgi:ferredoxin
MTGDRRLVVRIDAEKCQGHARCHALAPELFELDEFGSAGVRGSGHVSSALEDRAWIARGQLSGTGDRDRRGDAGRGLTSAH